MNEPTQASAAAPRPSLLPPERRAVAGLAAVASVRMLGLFMLMPVLALHADGLRGATAFLVGVSVGAYGITQALLQIPFGVASDRFGRRPVLLVGLAIFALGGALAAFGDHIGWVIAGRIVQGAGAVSAVLNALLADLTRAEVRTRAQAFFGASIGLSFMLSLMLGPVVAGRIGVDGLFAATSVLAAVAFLGVALFTPSAAPKGPARASGGWVEVLKDASLWGLYFGIFALHLVIAAAFVALPFVLRDRLGWAPERHWLIYLVTVTLSILTTVGLIRAVERSATPGHIVAAAVACLVLAQVAFVAGGASLAVIGGGLVLMFTGINFLEARLPAEVTLTAGEDRRGAALGVYASCQFLGVFAGGASAGALLGGALYTGV
ncbi:MAG: MFS transporter, partial [Pseudomonadota bacterium]